MVNTPSLNYAARTLSAGEAFQSKTSHAHSSNNLALQKNNKRTHAKQMQTMY